jgi:hypothetical protein
MGRGPIRVQRGPHRPRPRGRGMAAPGPIRRRPTRRLRPRRSQLRWLPRMAHPSTPIPKRIDPSLSGSRAARSRGDRRHCRPDRRPPRSEWRGNRGRPDPRTGPQRDSRPDPHFVPWVAALRHHRQLSPHRPLAPRPRPHRPSSHPHQPHQRPWPTAVAPPSHVAGSVAAAARAHGAVAAHQGHPKPRPSPRP